MNSLIPIARSVPPSLAVVIPCYRVSRHILDVIAAVGPEVSLILVVDDACPEHSGDHVEANCRDARVRVLRHAQNRGVGGAVLTGYRAALENGADIVVKVDGDGQMDPALIGTIARPVIEGGADYAKGNRFYSIWNVRQMPGVRLFGNAALSFLTKLSSGYWSIFDPTNGFTAIHADALRRLEFANISERYFFESDMLINLGNIRAVVVDVPMEAAYAGEKSNLRIGRVFGTFLTKNIRELGKRVIYNYFMRDFNLASAQLMLGLAMILFGTFFGGFYWYESVVTGRTSSTGTVMLATLPIILGFQLILSFLGFDMVNEPKVPIQPGWPARDRRLPDSMPNAEVGLEATEPSRTRP